MTAERRHVERLAARTRWAIVGAVSMETLPTQHRIIKALREVEEREFLTPFVKMAAVCKAFGAGSLLLAREVEPLLAHLAILKSDLERTDLNRDGSINEP